jgi:hypothetical protein
MMAVLLLAAALAQVQLEPTVVKLERREGRELWTVRARQASAVALLERVAELSGRRLEATSALERAPLIDVTLDRRPLEQVLEFALGGAGLRRRVEREALLVRSDVAPGDTAEELAGLAAEAWSRAAARFPRHPIAPSARLAQGELAELARRADAARASYLDLLASAPASPATGEALLRAGRLAAARRDWSEASEHFRALANLPDAGEYQAVARIELARATLALGDAEGALFIVAALEESHPCWDASEAAARALVRIEALLALGRHQDALLELDLAGERFAALGIADLSALRARALAGAGAKDEAARTLLELARTQNGPERITTYREAARLAEESGDRLGVLYVAREARAAGFGAVVAPAEERARQALGLEPPIADLPDAMQRLIQAERWLERRNNERASEAFGALFAELEHLELTPLVKARVVLGQVRCLRLERALAEAVALAKRARERMESAEGRQRLDLGMAALFAELGQHERAADAYTGDY